MILSIIVAASENSVIGRDNGLIWHLSADLKRFRVLTTGHTILMGRKTFESIGRALPDRRSIVISANPDFRAEGCEVVSSVVEALKRIEGDDEVFVIGGGSIYREFWNSADRLYLTRVHAQVEGDTVIPEILPQEWCLEKEERFTADGKNEFPYSFVDYVRIR